MKEYFKINKVAREFSEYDKIFENEKVDALMKKVADTSIEIFKRINFDLAPKKDRNVSTMKVKLSDIASSKDAVNLLAKVKDYSDDGDLSDGNFSNAKDLYMDSLNTFIEAMKAVEAISKEKGRNFVQYAKENAENLQASLNEIAEKRAKEAKNESIDYENSETLNEGLLSGYNGRVRKLKDLLTNLISSAEGKNSKDGYGKDWKRMFLDYNQKLSALDTTRDGTGTKDKEILTGLEKSVAKTQVDFNKAIINATDKELRNIENDDEVKDAYGDVLDLITKALDSFSTATTAQATAEESIKDRIEAREVKFTDDIFPVRKGDKDSDDKFDDSEFIKNLQRALMNGVSTIEAFLKGKGGADGIYGNATASIISALQKQSGNKNVNGELDRDLLDLILASDFVAPDDRSKIVSSLDKMRENNTNESLVSKVERLREKKVLSADEFFTLNEGEKIRLDKGALEDDIKTYYEEYRTKSKGSGSLDVNKAEEFDAKELAEDVAKVLRKFGINKMEADTFLKTDGTLGIKYSEKFLLAWKYAAENAKDSDDFFFFEDGLYALKSSSTSLKKPKNLPKWEDKATSGEDAEDYQDFVKNYASTFNIIGGLNRNETLKKLEEYYDLIGKKSNFRMKGVYDRVKTALTNEVPYISMEDLKGPVAKSLRNVIQEDEADKGEADLGIEDLLAINNISVMLASIFTYDGKKIITAESWVRENILTDEVLKRINSDGYYNEWRPYDDGPILSLGENGVNLITNPISGTGKSIRAYYGSTLSEVFGNVPEDGKFKKLSPSIKKPFNSRGILANHLKRMNAKNFEDVPQPSLNACIEVSEENLRK